MIVRGKQIIIMLAKCHPVFILKVSVFVNVVILLYAAVHYAGTSQNVLLGITEVPLTETVLNDEAVPLGLKRAQTTTSTQPTTNKTTTSSVSIAELEKKIDEEDSEVREGDESVVSEATLRRLQARLSCVDRDFQPRTMQRGEFWVLKNYVRADHGPLRCHETLTYTTHAGFEFFDNVVPLLERWMAPISLAIHAPGSDFQRTLDSIRYLRDCTGGSDLVRQYVTFHIFFSHKHLPKEVPDSKTMLSKPFSCEASAPYENFNESSTYMKEKSLLYPVNVARNIARDAALTHFILASDIELYPSANLVNQFLNMYARKKWESTNPRIFPISIFEVEGHLQVPNTKTELLAMLNNKTAIPFHKYVCSSCHTIPEAMQWMKALETKVLDVFHVGKRRGKYNHWEPIFIGTQDDPFYDERLSWEGKKDKMTQGYILCVQDYDFMILNNAFLCHKPGIKHFVKNPKRDAVVTKQNQYIARIIMPELKKLFGVRKGCSI